MNPSYRLPATVAAELAAQAAGDHHAAVPRDAASDILLREGPSGPEIYLLKRHRGMAFAGGMAVFPGGSVDASDSEAEVHWLGPTTAQWAMILGTPEPVARGLVVAAIRELFEETGVLLAGSPHSVVVISDPIGWEEDRRRVEAHEIPFAELLSRRGLAIRTDLIKPWAKGITPSFEPRRYATWFFVAALPEGQSALGLSTEAQSIEWITARNAISAADRGDLRMLPPQYFLNLELNEFETVDAMFASTRDLTAIEPLVGEDSEGSYLVIPQHLTDLGIKLGERLEM
jgi:8-oxo-dGTP pyrophosphatase MutT (NUDIX family)